MNWFVAACLLVLGGTGYAQDMGSGAFKSVYAAHDVSLETNPESAFWRGAAPVYAEVDTHGKLVPNHRTEVRSRWTKDNLYLLFVCPYEELHLKPSPNTLAETNELWNWDVAELFIGSDFQNIRRYKEFEVSPQGEWVDLDIDLASPHHEDGWTWNSGFKVAARIDPKAKVWYGVMRIPFAAIDERAPVAGNVFRANLFRGQGPPERQRSIAWKAPMKDTFHTPERFGQMELVKEK
jgi:cellulose/xylan binding protein with CBM9 domain